MGRTAPQGRSKSGFLRKDEPPPNAKRQRRAELQLDQQHLVVAQINLKGCEKRLRQLMEHVDHMKSPYDIIAFQDPPNHIHHNAMVKKSNYHLICGSRAPLSPESHPSIMQMVKRDEARRKKLGRKRKDTNLNPEGVVQTDDVDKKQKQVAYRVGFLVTTTIQAKSLGYWYGACGVNEEEVGVLEFTPTLGTPCPDATTGPTTNEALNSGATDRQASFSIRVTNLYNVNPANKDSRVDLEAVAEGMDDKGYDLVVGDFNLHLQDISPSAGDQQGELRRQAQLLQQLTLSHDLTCLTPKNLTTWTRGKTEVGSTIDLAFAGDLLTQLRTEQCTVPDLFTSDHRLITHKFGLQVPRDPGRVMWRCDEADRTELRQCVLSHLAEHISDASPGYYDAGSSPKEEVAARIDGVVQKIRDALVFGITQKVPKSVYRPKYTVLAADIAALKAKLSKLQKAYIAAPSSKTRDDVRHCIEEMAAAHNTEREEAACRRGGNTTQTNLHSRSKAAKLSFEPRRIRFMGALRENETDVIASQVTKEAKIQACARAVWTEQGASRVPTTDRLTTPKSAARRIRQRFSSTVTPAQVNEILRKLKRKKAADKTGASNDVLRLLAATDDEEPVFEQYLATLFTASLDAGYFPDAWKVAMTVMVPKPGKSRYDVIKNWRPIALLSVVGKVFEKIVASRFKSLAIQHRLMHPRQFASSGRSTEDALLFNFDLVYKGWADKQRVSQLCLDMKSAYDRVVPQKLLDILASKGLPQNLLNWFTSYLSDRRTQISIPGFDSEDIFHVSLGIAQGSPLSPFLFAFYTTPILEYFTTLNVAGPGSFAVWAFADDLNFLVWSSKKLPGGFERNCKILADLREKLIENFGKVGDAQRSSNEPFEGAMQVTPPQGEEVPVRHLDVEFGPHKYAVLHYRWRAAMGSEKSLPVPPIPGLPPHVVKHSHRVLGVIVDSSLYFDDHCQHIAAQVRKRIRYARRLTGATWGLSIPEMRSLFNSEIKPIITYACAAWFVSSDSFPPELMKRALQPEKARKPLEAVYRECLLQISGAFRSTNYAVLCRELDMKPVHILLQEVALRARTRKVWLEQQSQPANYTCLDMRLGRRPLYVNCKQQHALRTRKHHDEIHPYAYLLAEADECGSDALAAYLQSHPDTSLEAKDKLRRKFLRTPSIARRWIGKQASIIAARRASEWWEQKQADHYARLGCYRAVGVKGPWGREQYKLYTTNLTRAQTTMLIQLRSGHIGLNAYLKSYGALGAQASSACPCDHPWQTVEHVLLHCPRLAWARYVDLTRHPNVNTSNLEDLLSVHADHTTVWAIANLGLEQFAAVRQLYGIL